MNATTPAANRHRRRSRFINILGIILSIATFAYLANFYHFDTDTESDLAELKRHLAHLISKPTRSIQDITQPSPTNQPPCRKTCSK